MGKMMPLKWIEQAEARKVCVIAMSEAVPALISVMSATSFMSSLSRFRTWFGATERDRRADKPVLDRVVRLRRKRRAAS